MRQQIRRVKLKDQVADMLLDMISSGDYGAGDRLPPERVLVEQLGVSRTVVREALNLLETRGIIRLSMAGEPSSPRTVPTSYMTI